MPYGFHANLVLISEKFRQMGDHVRLLGWVPKLWAEYRAGLGVGFGGPAGGLDAVAGVLNVSKGHA